MFGTQPSRNEGMAFDADGFVFEDFLKNPILLVDHNLSVGAVVGRVANIHRVGDNWLADIQLLPRPANWEGARLPDLIAAGLREGVLGVSIDVSILSVRNPTAEDLLQFGPTCTMVAEDFSLIELSVVAVGAIPDAVPVDRLH